MSYDQWELVDPTNASNANSGAFGTVRKVRRNSVASQGAYQLGALKELKDASKPELVSIAKNEIAKISTVDHPNIARYIEDGLEDGLPWFVMGYVEGTSLKDLVEERGKSLSDVEWNQFVREILDALIYLESKSLSHLDLHPGNVIFTKTGHFTLVDFGLSASVYGKKKNIQHWGYAAPEQFPELLDLPESPASDVFAFAQMAYFIATKEPVWNCSNRDEKLWSLVNRPPNLDRLPAKYRLWLQPALARDPRNRPTARELFESFIAIDSIDSRERTAGEAMKTWPDIEALLSRTYSESIDFRVVFRLNTGAEWEFELDQDAERALLRMKQVSANRIPTSSNVRTRLDRLGWRAESRSSTVQVLKLNHADDTPSLIYLTLYEGFVLEVENLYILTK